MRKLFLPLLIVTAAMFVYAPIIVARAPFESTMFLLQKIMYFHVPSWMAGSVGIAISALGGLWFVFKGDRRADWYAVSGAEVALMFGAMGLMTGPIWARKAWGTWWTWDAKLTIALLLFLVFVAYLLLRKYGGPGSDKLSAAVALFGLVMSPFVYYAVDIWRTIHPANTVIPTLGPGMRSAFWFCAVTFLMFCSLLVAVRVRLEKLKTTLDDLYRAEDE
jgi:heme exporter protein C